MGKVNCNLMLLISKQQQTPYSIPEKQGNMYPCNVSAWIKYIQTATKLAEA